MSDPLILASKSPRRRELLGRCGVDFSVKTLPVTELESWENIALLPQKNAELKARAVARTEPGCWVLGADTMIIFRNRAIGKPETLPEAKEMLRSFSGTVHEVVTGLALINESCRISEVWSESSSVKFKVLDEKTISTYLAQVEVMDKAGAYAIQEHGELIVESFTGELENIIGLPLKNLLALLKKYSIGGNI
ncbi:MAG: septum formation protein Maf [Lentisphaeria bacterium]|nr:septum formation protein Maf [Lentisphaeria bacterium]